MENTNLDRLTVVHSVSTWLPTTETWLYTQVASLPENVISHIVCAHKENQDHFTLPNIHSLSDKNKLIYFTDRALKRLLKRRQTGFCHHMAHKLNPSIWHSHFSVQAWNDQHVVEECGAKHILSVYGADISQIPKTTPWDIRIPEVLDNVSLVLCEGPAMAKQVIELGCSPDRVKVHHLGVPLQRIPFQPRSWNSDSLLRVLIVGTFREKKGIPYAIEALAHIAHSVNIEITIIGDATSKPGDALEKARIMSLLKQTGLISKTRLLGFQPYSKVLEESQNHHIFISPSIQANDGDNEGGSPVIITEMAASGMLIVSSRHCDIPEVIPDGVAGLLAEERDVAGLTDHLRWLINNPECWLSMQQNARKHIENEYNAITQGIRLATIYSLR